jgi:hypothetical protein
MRTSTIVITPFCFMLAPVVLLLAASFTTLAVVTSVLAFAVIWIRLGFLVVEFSGGVTLDLLAWSMQKWVGESKTHHHNTRPRSVAKGVPVVDPSYLVDHNNVRPTRRHSRHHSTSRKISRSSKKRDVWNAEFVSPGDFGGHKDGVITKDNYYLVPNLVEPKRPHGRRSRSYDNSLA